jgi:protein-L-isoaspartate(D-aspartate) O-methyltransferase
MRNRFMTLLVAAILAAGASADALAQDRERAHLLWNEVARQIAFLGDELGFDRLSAPVRQALKDVPREEFVPQKQRPYAYENRPLPIGYAQTISQPLIVAIMSEMLAIEPGHRVFELGTGSGYQAAVLDQLGAEVYSIEIIPALAEKARRVLDENGHTQIRTRTGDGYFGWEEAGPFDAIMVTAASDHVPPPLVRQLKPGGRMLIPVGSRYVTQKLVLVTRDEQGTVRTREVLPVTFVPLTGQH